MDTRNKYVRQSYYLKNRLEVLEHYGGVPPKCKCCGEEEVKFLSIDHIDGGGKEHRAKTGSNYIAWFKKNNFPNGFQILCHNCNLAKGFYQECPHQTTPITVEELFANDNL